MTLNHGHVYVDSNHPNERFVIVKNSWAVDNDIEYHNNYYLISASFYDLASQKRLTDLGPVSELEKELYDLTGVL